MRTTFKVIGLFALCSFWAANEILAQDNGIKRDTTLKTYKWDASLDLYQLFYNAGANVMLRYSPTVKGAYRFQLGISDFNSHKFRSFALDTITQYAPGTVLKQNGAMADVKIGYEFHKGNNKHQLFYGVDLGYAYRFGDNSFYGIGIYKNHVISGYPFVGLKYRIVPRLSLSAEMCLRASYNLRKGFDQNHKLVSTFKQVSVGFEPLRFINLSYHF